MRLALCVVALVAACDGGPSSAVDAGPDGGGPPIDAPADANFDIAGTWLDNYITVNGTMSISVCSPAPSAVVVDATTAVVTPYGGTCKPDGSFRINAMGNLGTYYLKVGGALYETTKHAGLDLSTDRLGRNDPGTVANVDLAFNMTGIDAWQPGDLLTAFAANIGFYQNLTFTAGGPQDGGTNVTGTAPWGGYKIEAAKSDALQIVQLGVHTTPPSLSYLSLDRAYTAPPLTMENNTPTSISGAFTAPPAGTIVLDVDVASFNQFATVANPNVALKTIAGTVYAAASPETIPSPALISFARESSTVSALDFGTLGYGDPFPTAWQRYVKIQEAFSVPYTWNNVTGTLNAQMTRVMTKAEAQANPIDAKLGPPTNPKLDGANGFTATNISPVPVVSWDAPTLGTPTDYEVVVYEAQISGTDLKFIPTLRLSTKQTSIRVPAGYLLSLRQYVFVIRARSRDGSDLYSTPLRNGASLSTAETVTALVTTDS
jgi:hypothetical protein